MKSITGNDKCLIYSNCKVKDTAQCDINCSKYVQLKFQYSVSNIPKKYIKEHTLSLSAKNIMDENSYRKLNEYKKNIYKNVAISKGAFIWGHNKGNGKTSWAIKIMKEYFRQLHNFMGAYEKPYGLYVNVPTFFKQMRDSFNSENTKEIRTLEKNLIETELLVFDDIGTEAPTTWVKESLYIIINQREMEQKTTIFTSNLSLEDLESEDLLGTRIVDRIYSLCLDNIIELKGPSWRRGGNL